VALRTDQQGRIMIGMDDDELVLWTERAAEPAESGGPSEPAGPDDPVEPTDDPVDVDDPR
jgi:hypothetical protein